MKKILLGTVALVVIALAVTLIVRAGDSTKETKKAKTEVVKDKSGCCSSADCCSSKDGKVSCNPEKCAKAGCDPEKCKKDGCDPAKCTGDCCGDSDKKAEATKCQTKCSGKKEAKQENPKCNRSNKE